MTNHPLSELMTSSMAKIREMVDVNTVIGEPITTPDGVTLIPLTKVSMGYGGGGADFAQKATAAGRDNSFGGGAGVGVTIVPIAFVIIRGESVRILPVTEPASGSVDRIIELVPELMDRFEDLLRAFQDKRKEKETQI